LEILKFIEEDNYLKIKVELKKLDDVNIEVEDENENEESLLSFAIHHRCDMDTILMMIEVGCDVNYTNNQGVGILDLAVEKNNLTLVKYLVESHNFNPTKTKRKSGFTPFMEAVCYNYLDMCKYLISQGADVKGRDNSNLTALDYAKKLRIKPMIEFLQ